MKKIIWLLVALVATEAMALQVKPIANNEITQANISARELSRISIRGDRIQYVRGVDGAYTFKADKQSGAIYIKPSLAYQAKPFTIHVETEGHHHYRLLLTPKDVPAETVVLMSDTTMSPVTRKASLHINALVLLTGYMHQGKAPVDYVIIEQAKKKAPATSKGLIKQLQTTYKGKYLVGYVYQLDNQSDVALHLQEKTFYQPNTLSVALDNHGLKSKGSTRLYVIERVRGES